MTVALLAFVLAAAPLEGQGSSASNPKSVRTSLGARRSTSVEGAATLRPRGMLDRSEATQPDALIAQGPSDRQPTLRAQAPTSPPGPVLLAPGAVAQTTRDRLHVFLDVPRALPVLLDGADAGCVGGPKLTRDGGTTLLHCSLTLAPGEHAVTTPLADGGVERLATLRRWLTLGPVPPGVELLPSSTRPSDGGCSATTSCSAVFGPGTVHQPEVERVCRECHRLDERFDGGAVEQCRSCHAEVSERKVMHGPVQQGACLACHDQASAPSRFAVKWPIQETCFGCHVDVKATMMTKAVRHGPAAAGRCTTCHDPHGSDQPYWLKLHAFDLCTNCHTEKRERHVVVGFVYGDSHPLRGRPHPLKDRTEFSCPSCHNPHAAQARFLWQFDATQRETLCRTCHQK